MLGAIAAAALCACTEDRAGAARGPAGAATALTAAANARAGESLPRSDAQAREDATRGLIARPTGRVLDGRGEPVWDFDAFAFVAGEAPPTVNPSLWRQAALNNHSGLFEVTDGVYQLRGFDLANLTLIEGASGWIVVDTLTARETAAAAMAFARAHLGERAVTAVIFTHSHLDHFGGVLGVIPAEQAAARAIPIVAPAGFMEEATSENVLAGPAMSRRAQYMYGSALPRDAHGLVDNGLGKAVAFGRAGILAPTQLVGRTPQEMTLDGVRFVFHDVSGSEAPAELTFTLPDRRAYCGAEMLSHTLHNLYTLRGAKVRDPLRWAGHIDDALRALGDVEVYFGQHHWPVWGRERIAQFLTMHRDAYRYIHDQSVRLLNAGLTAREIAEQIEMPATLADFLSVHGYYGTLRHNAKAVYQHYMGWFDANPAHLDPLPPEESARRYVALLGGASQVVAYAQAAFDAGEYRWAAELLDHVVYARADDEPARELLARTYEQLAYVAEAAPWRNFYLTGARELRHGPPAAGVDRALFMDLLAHTPAERFLEALAASLDGPAAEGVQLKIDLVFSDLGESYALWVENSVLHHRRAPPSGDADVTLTLTRKLFLELMTGSASLGDVLLGDQLTVDGSTIDLVRFFALIDRAPGNFAIVTP